MFTPTFDLRAVSVTANSGWWQLFFFSSCLFKGSISAARWRTPPRPHLRSSSATSASALTAARSRQWHAPVATRTSFTAPMLWRCRFTECASPSRSNYTCPSQKLYSRWAGTSCKSLFSIWFQSTTLKCCLLHRNWPTRSCRRTPRSTRFMVRECVCVSLRVEMVRVRIFVVSRINTNAYIDYLMKVKCGRINVPH